MDWIFLVVFVGGLEVIVCFFVIEDSCFVVGWVCVEVGFFFVVFVVVWCFKVVEIVDLVVFVLFCVIDFKEVWDVDFFILGGGCNCILKFNK